MVGKWEVWWSKSWTAVSMYVCFVMRCVCALLSVWWLSCGILRGGGWILCWSAFKRRCFRDCFGLEEGNGLLLRSAMWVVIRRSMSVTES